MHPTRDFPIFLEMVGDNFSKIPISCWIEICYSPTTKKLSYYPNVSVDKAGNIICPKGYVPYGWGGAMGPAQFIPSTWKLYEKKVKEYTGKAVASPWDFEDAFFAAALYLKDLGGATSKGEYYAASRYYGGSSTYAGGVAERAWCIQQYIDNGSMSSACEKLIFPNY
jgi:hypothetical protein